MNKRITAAFLALCLLGNAMAPVIAADELFSPAPYSTGVLEKDDSGAYTISSLEDYLTFAEGCKTDSFSQGQRFVLTKDISFADREFISVPSFSGVFEGNGHKLTGITVSGDACGFGAFRYIEPSGRVKDLTVSAKIASNDSSHTIGGIAGINRGTVSGCTFEGQISARERVGGIAAINEETGLITNCTCEGLIKSEHFTGGIAAENEGFILRCTNNAYVNTDVTDSTPSIDQLSNISIEDLGRTESLSSNTDMGGIAGFSAGTISDCVNNGNVGYEHIGYNIGGIAGRQSGYIFKCENYGIISGRKDTGGIVGQAEPYVSILFSESSANELRQRLEEFSVLADKTIRDINARSDVMGSENEAIIGTLGDLRDTASRYGDKISAVIDEDTATINELSARISDLIDRTEPITDNISQAADNFTDALDSLFEAADLAAGSGETADEGLAVLRPALDDISDIVEDLGTAGKSFESSMDDLKGAFGDPGAFSARLADVRSGLQTIYSDVSSISYMARNTLAGMAGIDGSDSAAVQDIIRSLDSLATDSGALADELDNASAKLDTLSDRIADGTATVQDYRDAFDAVADILGEKSLADTIRSLSNFASSVSAYISALAGIDLDGLLRDRLSDTDRSELANLFDTEGLVDTGALYAALDDLSMGAGALSDANESTEALVERIKDTWDYLDDSSAQLMAAVYVAVESIHYAEEGVSLFDEALSLAHDASASFKSKAELVFKGGDEESKELRHSIAELAKELGDGLVSLNSVTLESVDIISADMVLVNEKLDEISNLVADILEEMQTSATDLESYREDISAEDTVGRSNGKIASCTNAGKVYGDVSSGGIAGAMGVENTIDPEGDLDISGSRSLDFIYRTKTVIRDCENTALVTAKRNSAGGITGDNETGCVISCTNTGNVVVSDGDYAGGIAGKSTSAIYGCTSMCSIQGSSYTGGIAGTGHDIEGCTSFVLLKGVSEYYGAVAGTADGSITANVFVYNGAGGVDNVSYSGRCDPLSYEEMTARKECPEELKSLTLTFVTGEEKDEKVVAEINVPYSGSLADSDIPEIPEHHGELGKWDREDFTGIVFSDTIRAVYYAPKTTIAADSADGAKRAPLLIQGSFADDDTVTRENNKVCINTDSEGPFTVRYLPEGGTDRTVLRVDGITVNTVTDGSYLVFETSSKEFILTESKTPIPFLLYGLLAGGAVLVIIIIGVTIHGVKKHRRKK